MKLPYILAVRQPIFVICSKYWGLRVKKTTSYKMNSCLFEAWFESVLLPELTEPSVIVLDNARFHRLPVLAKIAAKKGHKILALEPYSPELNPIEKAWANIQTHLRKVLPEMGSFMDA